LSDLLLLLVDALRSLLFLFRAKPLRARDGDATALEMQEEALGLYAIPETRRRGEPCLDRAELHSILATGASPEALLEELKRLNRAASPLHPLELGYRSVEHVGCLAIGGDDPIHLRTHFLGRLRVRELCAAVIMRSLSLRFRDARLKPEQILPAFERAIADLGLGRFFWQGRLVALSEREHELFSSFLAPRSRRLAFALLLRLVLASPLDAQRAVPSLPRSMRKALAASLSLYRGYLEEACSGDGESFEMRCPSCLSLVRIPRLAGTILCRCRACSASWDMRPSSIERSSLWGSGLEPSLGMRKDSGRKRA
jgi:hypothetical protein